MKQIRRDARYPSRRGSLLRVLVVALLLFAACSETPRSSEPQATAPRSERFDDPLPSWADGPTRSALLEFVEAITDEEGPDYVVPAERIATFDNDGTLWVEAPIYTQLVFAFDRLKELAPQHPEWSTTQPYQAALVGDMETLGAAGMEGLMQIVMASHSGMTSTEFEQEVSQWFKTARDSRFGRPYTELVYQPQLELLAYLRDNGFRTFIVSGGGTAFMRPMTEEVYGIAREQVVGSRIVSKYQQVDGEMQVVRTPELGFIDDQAGKPVGIYEHIGRRPILAFGNSDGDLQMVEWTTSGEGRRLGLFVHHTDADREYAYDRDSHVGKLDQVLDRADEEGWILVDMKNDWIRVFPWE